MTPTLSGRLQTRAMLMILLAVPWTLIIAPLIGLSLGRSLLAMLVMAVLGLGWELGYHAIQQLRWDKDWPSLVALLVGVPEALLLWLVLGPLGLRPGGGAFATLVGSTWLLLWLVQQGPLKVIAPAWRFHGARLIEPRPVVTAQPGSALHELLTPAAEPEPAPEPTAKRAPKPRRRPLTAAAGWFASHRPSLGRPVQVALLAAVVLAAGGWWLSNNVGGEDTPTAAAHQPTATQGSGQQSTDRSAKKGAADTSQESTNQDSTKQSTPKSSQPVAWQVPSDHRIFKTWDKNSRVNPYAITIPRLDLQKKLGSVGLTPAGTMQTPKKPGEAAWYQSAAAPGQVGPGVIVGAMKGRTAVFHHLGQLVHGDTLLVTRMDSTTIQFLVDKVQRVPFGQFPTRSVYGMTDDPQLRLVGFVPPRGKKAGYNVIVYGSALRLLQPKQES